MTDFLTIAAVPYPVQIQGSPTEGAPEYVGSRERAMSGNMRSTRTAATRKRTWTFALGPITQAAFGTFVTATAGDAVVAVSGAAIAGGPVNCMVDMAGKAYVPNGPSDYMVVVTVDILEV